MAKPNDREIGARIAALREQRGWSQRALAKVLGMNQSVLSRIEAGKRRVSATELDELAAALDVSVDVVLTGAERAPAAARPRVRRGRLTPPADTPRAAFYGPPEPLAAGRLPSRSRDALPLGTVRHYDIDSQPAADGRPVAGDRHAADDRHAGDDRGETGRDYLGLTLDERIADSLVERSIAPGPVYAALGTPLVGASPLQPGPPPPPAAALPAPAETVIADYLRLRDLAAQDDRPRVSSISSRDALGRRRPVGPAPWSVTAHVGVTRARDRYARFMRHELGIGADGPVPDLVTLFEDTGVAEVIVARLQGETPVAASVTAGDVAFVLVNAARPVALQRFALAHSVAHLVLGHGDVVDERIAWSRAEPFESEANDFAEEFLAPVDAVARWYERHGDPRPSVDVLIELAATFGITPWSALYRSRAAERLNPKLQTILARELREREWSLLPEQALRGGLRDTLSSLSDEAPPPPPGARGVGGAPAPAHLTREPGPAAVLRVPARMTGWALTAVREGRLSLEEAARILHHTPAGLFAVLRQAGLE